MRVDLRTGEQNVLFADFTRAPESVSRFVWSEDGEWLLVAGDRTAIVDVSRATTFDLWDWIPPGMELFAVAAG